MPASKRNELRQRAFALHKLSLDHCLEPSEACEKLAIRAHSIQNSRILERLCDDGHVVMPTMKMGKIGPPTVSFELVGRNKATSFTGLCSEHDQRIFAPIDTGLIDVGSDEHMFLLAYRSVLRELHSVMVGAAKNQGAFLAKVELGLVPGDVPTPDGIRALEFCMNAYESYLYKREYDSAYIQRDFNRIEHVHFFEGNRPATVATSALFSLDNIAVNDDVARVALNVYPSGNGVMVVFSFLRCHEHHIQPFIDPFTAASGDTLLQMISGCILNSCENFVLSPTFWNGFSDQQKIAVQDLFGASLFSDLKDLPNTDVMLFSPTQT